MMQQRRTRKKPVNRSREHYCYFCSNNLRDIDYKEINILQKFTSNYQKILPRSRMGSCAKHQRKLEQAVKRARFMALLPFMNDQQ